MDDDVKESIVIFLLIIVTSLLVSILTYKENIKPVQSQLSSLESRIARQEEIIEHHIKKAAFDSMNQVQAFKKIGK